MKKMVLTVMMALALAGCLFASGSTEYTRAWFEADKKADASVKYIATERNAVLELKDGTVYSADASYTLKNADLLVRSISGDSEVFALLDTLSDGFVLTPFEDDIIALDKSYVRTEEVDGRACYVYEADAAVFESIFFYGKEQGGELLGYDEGDTDGSVKLTVWIDAATNEIVKETVFFDELNALPDLTLTQEVTFTNENGQNVPSEIITTGHCRISAAKNFPLFEDVDFTITEKLSGYTYMDSYRHN